MLIIDYCMFLNFRSNFMNKMLTLIATISFCTITTVMNGAEQPFAWEKQFKQEALEASRLGMQWAYKPGTEHRPLTTEAIAKIKEYLKPMMKPIKIVNYEDHHYAVDFEIFFQDPKTGKLFKQFTLYSNPSMFSDVPELLYREGMKHEESSLQFFERRAKETGKFFEQLIDLPVAQVTLIVVDHAGKNIYGYITLHASEIENLKSIKITIDEALLDYNDPKEPWEFTSYVKKDYKHVKNHEHAKPV